MSVTTNEGQPQLLAVNIPRHRNTFNRDEEAAIDIESRKRFVHLPSDSTIRVADPGGEKSTSGEPFFTRSWNGFLRKGKTNVGFMDSLKATAFSSWLNVFLIFVPLAWISHFLHWQEGLTFALCFLAILPLAKLSEFGGEQLAFYLGKDLGDFFVVSLNNVVEATLAIILLKKCELRLLQSTIIGVVILHVLLIPGTAFFMGGARLAEQLLHPHIAQMNHVLLTIGVLTLALPSAFFIASDRIAPTDGGSPVDPATAQAIISFSRGLAIILLTVYLCSRIYLYDPPGPENSLQQHPLTPEALKHEEELLLIVDPEINQWVCLGMLAIAIGLMAATAEWLVDSIAPLENHIPEEWFGLVLLPLCSFSADGAVAAGNFVKRRLGHATYSTLAKAQAIDMSIQFILLWLPFIVLLGWWTGKPMSMLFDLFEVVAVVAACFIVNYVTADAKTNYAEGYAMVAFYVMIALCSWFYQRQSAVEALLRCAEA